MEVILPSPAAMTGCLGPVSAGVCRRAGTTESAPNAEREDIQNKLSSAV